jgi:hypothetical protein
VSEVVTRRTLADLPEPNRRRLIAELVDFVTTCIRFRAPWLGEYPARNECRPAAHFTHRICECDNCRAARQGAVSAGAASASSPADEAPAEKPAKKTRKSGSRRAEN